MQPAQVRLGHDLAFLGRLDRSRRRRVPGEREMRACLMVVLEVRRQNPTQVILAQHDHVIVGTVKKSIAAIWPTWFFRKVRQFCDGGLGWRIMYLATVDSATLWPRRADSD